MKNRSVPTDTILAHITYREMAQAAAWLTATFGFTEHYRHGGGPDGPVSGAQMHLGQAWIMLRRAGGAHASPAQCGFVTQSLTVFVDDVHAHFRRAKAAGAELVEDLHETIYGELQYGVADLEGHRWLFSQHARELDPKDWGATVAEG